MKQLFFLLLFGSSQVAFAQKPHVTPEIAEEWGGVRESAISNNGKYLMYATYLGSSSTIVFQSTLPGWKRQITNYSYSTGMISSNSRYGVYKIKGDSLVIITLGTNKTEQISNVEDFEIPKQNGGEWLAYKVNGKTDQIVLKNLKTTRAWNFSNVLRYMFSEDGKTLLLQKETGKNNQALIWVELDSNITDQLVWSGEKIGEIIFSQNFSSIAFSAKNTINNLPINEIWYCKKDNKKSIKLTSDQAVELEDSFVISEVNKFNDDDNAIVFSLKQKSKEQSKPKGVNVDVWSYTDPKLQSNQLWQMRPRPAIFGSRPAAQMIVRIEDGKIIRLGGENEKLKDCAGDFAALFCEGEGDITGEWNWNKTASNAIDIVSVKDGTRKRILDKLIGPYHFGKGFFRLSPGGKYLIYFDPNAQNYFSYNPVTGITKCITAGVQAEWTSFLHRDEPDADYRPIGTADVSEYMKTGFINNGDDVLLFSRNDLFQVNVSGSKPPINLTNGYGRKNNLAFRLLFYNENIKHGDKLILNTFDRNNNNNGFYSVIVGKSADPVLLAMQPCLFAGADESNNADVAEPVTKARDANIYMVKRQTASESPNVFLTTDFTKFTQISNYYPERDYNWLTSELHKWKGLDGTPIKGVLYKPENFDSTKKYPVIFFYYEKLSEGLHKFNVPQYSSDALDIPYFVTNDYLVFVPDIPKIMGHPGLSAVNAVVSAANYLSTKSYVDSTRLGLQGHSFGGFETNYIITHSNKFAAAMSASSMSDFFSIYGSVNPLSDGTSRQRQFEVYHDAIGASMWERPDCYIENSPVLYADKVTTPVLMMSNQNDDDVPFAQGVEFFTALRRLGKRAWMLQYDGEGHSLGWTGRAVSKDFTIRMHQFFDHYLKNKPAPVWMTRGIPAKYKGIKDGFEYDTDIKTPIKGGLLTPEEKQKIDAFKNRQPFTIIVP